MAESVQDFAASANQVLLRGKVTAASEDRELPSGATVATFRISVARETTAMTSGSKQAVDVIDCVAWAARTRKVVSSWRPGDLVEVEGSLRRRFFKAASGTGSRVEVEVLSGRRVSGAKASRAKRAG